ncbi:dolichyl-diphosphooligosaccharide--protein glycosyltransferase subunit 2 [Cephus cinctus]|uniref:Dolichyl-diphosphooligosaccharide--protein glycosyltransferase subunit 2 n=1 Tax=Cephus cinctus TaxID=211228 RepID=A0AAJ7BUM2_CEPCN|nr:dolichyl-diphosphooligosaccharide--protein glycosyltransferase subunit 2 [Cephus cinctus]
MEEGHVWCLLLIVLIMMAWSTSNHPSTDSYLSVADKARFKKVIDPGFKLDDLSTAYYAVIGYQLIEEPVPKSAEICKFVQDSVGDGSVITPENAFYAVGIWKALGSCKALPKTAIAKVLTAAIEKDTSAIPDLYFAVKALTSLSEKLSESTTGKLTKTLQAALKKDDSLLNLGYTFNIASDLGLAGLFAFERVEDAVVQADEVDGRYLQFEGGLSVTSLLINGIFKLSSSLKKTPPVTTGQTVKLANYLLSRRSVQTPKGVVSLLSSLTTLANNEFHHPICITLADGGIIVSAQQPLIKVKVCDILGRPLSKTPTVAVNTATRIGDDAVVMSKKNFQASSDKTLFTVNFMDIKPERGFYNISVSADSVSNIVTVKVLSEVIVDYLEIGTGDADQTTQPKLTKVVYPNKLGQKIEADSQQKLVVRFLLKDAANKKPIRVHQAFVRISSVSESKSDKHGHEIIFVAEPDASHVYKFDMPLATAASTFGYQSGDYNLELVVGDAVLSNSFQWTVAEVSLKFPELPAPEPFVQTGKSVPYKQKPLIYTPLPEIKHMFREPEKRPPVFVSNLFTGLCLLPVLILFILWAKLGVNISNFPFSLSAVTFHLGLGSIFVLMGIFWLQLNMFVTLKYLFGLSIVTFLSGNKLLSYIAHRNKGR